MRFFRLVVTALLLAFLSIPAGAQEPQWTTRDAAGETQVQLYFFWSSRCPHCLAAKPFVESLPARLPWLRLHSYEVLDNPGNARLYAEMAHALGGEATSVPAFLFCGQMQIGFDSAGTSGAALMQQLQACRSGTTAGAARLSLPLLGSIDSTALSLPLFTFVIAGLDAFNPCAFFVLLFLLSLLAREHSRMRMLLVGGVFVAFSGLIYFVFMAAWLNVFLVLGEIRAITAAAAAIAIAMALINIKDFFRFRQGITLSIPEQVKPGLFRRMRGLPGADSWPLLVLGTAALAVAANSYELLCTAGFPMVYTRVLTLHHLGSGAYYGYLAFYNLVYVIPLLAIVLTFTFTLGSRKLTEHEGRLLKLMSGVMMLELGALLLLAPEQLGNAGVAAGLLLVAIACAALAKRMGIR